MIKILVTIILSYSLLACNDAEKAIVKDLPVVGNDTFDFYNEEYDIPIAEGFKVDTLKYFEKRTDYAETLIYPAITGKEYTGINEIVRKEIKRKAVFNTVDVVDHGPVDSSKEAFGVELDHVLLQMYKYKNLVSYGFLNIFSDPNAMRPFRSYFTINYDTADKRFIYFSDYFKVVSASDSTFLKLLIYQDIGLPDPSLTLNNQINFSIDKENVYFYFDMFGVFGNPQGLVKKFKKKYLLAFINEAYK